MKIALLGTGIMGMAMARNWLAAKCELAVWNRSTGRVAPLAALGASIAETAAGAARDADVIVTMLSDGAAVEQVMAGGDGALAHSRREAIWIQMSTVGVSATERLLAMARAAGVAFVDAPVLGTRAPAEQGKLIVLGSGDERLRARCEQVFGPISRRVLWLGEAGASSRLKLVANQWSTGMVALLSETVTLARALGLDPADFFALIDGSDFSAPYAQTKGVLMMRGEFPPSFPLDLAHKDVRLVLAAAADVGQSLPVTAAIERQYELAERCGRGRDDLSAILCALRDEAR